MLELSKLPPRAAAAFMQAVRHGDANGRTLTQGSPLGQAITSGGTVPLELAGLVPSDDDVRDYPFAWSGRPVLADIDLRPECSPIKNQGAAGACTAFHLTGHAERLANRAGVLPAGGYSERANYAMSRGLLGFTGDSGATLRAAIHAAYKFGLPLEATFPYSDAPATIADLTIPDAVMAEAAGNKLDAYYRVEAKLTDEQALNGRIDRALADGYTVGIGTWLFRWFFYIRGALKSHPGMRDKSWAQLFGVNPDTWWDMVGAHAMVIVGRSDALGGYIVRNSWGTGWGDGGYYLLAYGDTQFAFEFWAVAGFDGSDVGAPYDMGCTEAKAFRLYRAALGRYPEAAGLAYQAGDIAAAGHLQVARNFMASPEFQQRYGTLDDTGFVTALYRNVLRREPEPAGLQYHLQELAGGMERAQVLINFAESPENRAGP